LSAAILNQLFHLGHASDVEEWLPARDMPAHFRPDHLGRAPANFDESQLVHWQKETLSRMSTADIGSWLGLTDSTSFIELVRHNVVLPGDAAHWLGVVNGELPPLGDDDRRVIETAGPAFFAAAVTALAESGTDWKRLTQILKERTGRRGAELFRPLRLALTGQGHGPELGPLLKLIPAELARRRLESHAQNP
jgi:glutamyl-tRNA synthetase